MLRFLIDTWKEAWAVRNTEPRYFGVQCANYLVLIVALVALVALVAYVWVHQ